MNTTRLLALIGTLTLGAAAGAFANDAGGACQEDMKRLCGEVKPGGGAIHDCMKSHESELSSGCKEKMADRKKQFEEKKKEVLAACGADIKQYCANVTPGHGREIDCLKSYEDKISAGCKDKLPKRMHHGMRKGMSKDMKDGPGAPPAMPEKH